MSRRFTTIGIFEVHQEEFDSFGPAVGEYEEVLRAFLSLEPLAGRELIEAQQVQAETTHKARMHFDGRVNTTQRVRVERPGVVDPDPTKDSDWRIFQIESAVNVNEANRELELRLVERG